MIIVKLVKKNKMKALINTKEIKKALLTIIAVTLISSTGMSQGILVEGAGNLFKALMSKKQDVSMFVLAKGQNETRVDLNFPVLNDFRDRMDGYFTDSEIEEQFDFAPIIVKSFEVEDVYVSFENGLKTEPWMTESFADQMESEMAAEGWMSESFSTNVEADVDTEAWMTESFTNKMENEISTEGWMKTPFTEGLEQGLTVEDWMLTSFDEKIESPLEVEDWMTTPFDANQAEADLNVEDWMLKPFHKQIEVNKENENWIVSQN